jgi:hypothetical protein
MNKVLSLELFKECINTLREQEENERKAIDGLRHIMDGSPIITNKTTDLLVKLPEEIFDDKHNNISWWLWEDVPKEIYHDNGIVKKVDTIENFYDYLIENKK